MRRECSYAAAAAYTYRLSNRSRKMASHYWNGWLLPSQVQKNCVVQTKHTHVCSRESGSSHHRYAGHFSYVV